VVVAHVTSYGAEPLPVRAALGRVPPVGPLEGIRVLEVPNLGPVQFAGMLLGDLGAEVVRLDRASDARRGAGAMAASPFAVLDRNRLSLGVDLKHPDGPGAVLRLVERADVIVEGFRPGVAERLGIGPEACRTRNPRLVYGRMTGWGRDGPRDLEPGHDINYIALSGVLAHIGARGGPPVPPINLIGDFGGGAMFLVVGILAALVERAASGLGQVVDAAMVDGGASLMGVFHGLDQMGAWSAERGTNVLDGGAPFYGVYETADGGWVSVGAFEERFYAELLRALGLDDVDPARQMDPATWPGLRERFASVFRGRTRDEWVEAMRGREVCFAPVLDMGEARRDPHLRAWGTFTEVDGVTQPAPAPRFDRTPGGIARSPVPPGTDTSDVLAAWGFAGGEIEALRESGAVV